VVMPNQVVETLTATGGATEAGRRPAVVAPPVAVNPELSDRPRRRTFSAQEKLRILGEADRATEPGAIGALLRREGLYSSAPAQAGAQNRRNQPVGSGVGRDGAGK
jgi:hypothetical protein